VSVLSKILSAELAIKPEYSLPSDFSNRSAGKVFDSLPEGAVTADMILDSTDAAIERSYETQYFELDSLAKAYDISLINYEAGDHMYDYKKHHWNDSLYAAQCH